MHSSMKQTMSTKTPRKDAAEEKPRRKLVVPSRKRPIKACMECRRRKNKCDRKSPCSICLRDNYQCLYVPHALAPEELAKIIRLKRRKRALESALEQQVARPVSTPEVRKQSHQDQADGIKSEDNNETSQLNRFAVAAAAYEEDENAMDIGICIGKCQLTGRVAGYLRPVMADGVSVQFS